MEIAHAEFGALDVHGKEDFASSTEILDVAIPAVLGAARDGSSAFFADFGFDIAACATSVHVVGLGGLGDNAVKLVGLDELAFAAVPFGQNFGGGRTAQYARVDKARKADVRDVPGGAEYAFKVPDGFGSVGRYDG